MGIVDETDKLSLGMLGMHGNAAANFAVQDADLILAIGYRFCDRTTGNLKDYAIKAKQAGLVELGGIVHFNIDDSEFNRVVNSDININGDCYHNLNFILKKIEKMEKIEWINKIIKLKKKFKFSYNLDYKDQIKTQNVIEEIYNFTKSREDVIITTGVGNHQMMAAQFYNWKYPKRIITSGSLGTMGVGLPFAIGSKLANPEKKVICIDGDGSFNMTFNDLTTISSLKLPILIFIMNDGKQQMVNIWQNLFFDKKYIATDNYNPDYCKLAESFNIDNYKIENKKDLLQLLDFVFDIDKPVIIDCKVQPDICLPLIPPGNSLSDMILDKKFGKIDGLAPS